MAKKQKPEDENGTQDVLDVPVQFGGVSIGDATARLGVRIDRSVLNINAADETFCGHRLTGQLVLGGHDDQPGQQTMVDDLHETLSGTFDCKRIGLNQKAISTGLTFSLADIDVAELARSSRGSGRLKIHAVQELHDDDADYNEEGDEDETAGTLKAEGPWREVRLAELFKGRILKALTEADIETIGQLHDYTATGDKRLDMIPNLGPVAIQAIEDTMLEFWASNPQYQGT